MLAALASFVAEDKGPRKSFQKDNACMHASTSPSDTLAGFQLVRRFLNEQEKNPKLQAACGSHLPDLALPSCLDGTTYW